MSLSEHRFIRRLHDMWENRSLAERVSIVLMGVALVGLAVLLPLHSLWIKPALNRWRLERTMEQAARYDAAQDYRNLLLSLSRAAQLSSHDIETWRRIADYLSGIGDNQVISARQRVVHLAPGDESARLALAADALRFGRLKIGQDALEPLPLNEVERDARYQRLAGSIALHLGDISAMKTHLAQVIALRPADHEAALDLAIAQTWSLDPAERQQGRARLETLLTEPTFRVRAAVELIKDTARAQDGPRAAALIPRLNQALPVDPAEVAPATLDRAPPLDQLIARLQLNARSSDTDIAVVADWLLSVRRNDAALAWLQSFAPERLHGTAITEIYTELLLTGGQLGPAVRPLLDGTFGPISSDTLLLALGARRLQETNHLNAAKTAWDEAVASANGASHNGELRVLARLATLWQQLDWSQSALQAVVVRSPQAFWAYAALRDQWVATGETERVWSLLNQWVQRDAGNLDVVSAWLRLGNALPGMRERLLDQAADRIDELPESPRTTAIRAGWLWIQGQADAARDLLSSAGPDLPANPDSAYWCALVSGSSYPGTDFPALAQLALLPEERALLASPAAHP